MTNNAITQTMKNRATMTRFVLVQGTHQAIKTKRWHIMREKNNLFSKIQVSNCV